MQVTFSMNLNCIGCLIVAFVCLFHELPWVALIMYICSSDFERVSCSWGLNRVKISKICLAAGSTHTSNNENRCNSIQEWFQSLSIISKQTEVSCCWELATNQFFLDPAILIISRNLYYLNRFDNFPLLVLKQYGFLLL